MWALNNVTAPDNYTAAATLTAPSTVKLNITVSNQAIFYKFTQVEGATLTPRGGGTFQPEVYLIPGFYNFRRRTSQIAVRAAIPAAQLPAGANQAVVTVEALSADD